MILLKIFVFILLSAAAVKSLEFKGLQFWLNLFMERKPDESNTAATETDLPSTSSSNSQLNKISNGHSNNSFLDYVLNYNKCRINDLREKQIDDKKPIIKIKCVKGRGNGTIQVIETLKDAVAALAPFGNSTKRDVEGSCALILFYTKSCTSSAQVAPHFNALGKQFPDIKMAAIDSFVFHSFNTEFGIVGVPSILLFHQGRPMVKFNDTSTVNNFIKFIEKHTGLTSRSPGYVSSSDFNGPLALNKMEKEFDPYLYLSWIFIIVTSCYYFSKSNAFVKIIEMIKRNWRESEAQLESN